MTSQTAYRIVKRYTYCQDLAVGFPSYESADAFNRKYFLKDEVFGPEGFVEAYDGAVTRNESGDYLDEPVQYVRYN